MTYDVLLSGGASDADTVVVGEPWPRRYIYVAGETYEVTDDVADPALASYVTPPTEDEDPPEYVGVGAQGPAGPAGPDGAVGPTGAQGDDGLPINPTGPYSDATVYERLDLVDFEGSSYVSLENGNVDHEPPNVDWWALSASIGDVGPQGDVGDTGPQGDPGSPLPTRESVAIVTASLAEGAGESDTVELAEGYRILAVEANRACRVRLYTTPTKRTADVARPVAEDPAGDHGCVLEMIFDDTELSYDLSPTPNGYSMEDPPVADIAYRIENLSVTTDTIDITLIWQPQES